MKLLTITVPSYNSQDYLDRCIETLVQGGPEVEVLIVDDGSKDRTAEMADNYEKQYTDIVRAIHQPNKGHGGAVNTGIANAQGVYFKVVDSDDWVDVPSFKKVLDVLRDTVNRGQELDMLISNYVNETVGTRRKHMMEFRRTLPMGTYFTWNDIKKFPLGHYMLIHALTYRTQLLRDCGLQLPEHTFYVDENYVYLPLPHVKKMYYLDVPFYRYYVGRPDQSVNEATMIKRIDQCLKVERINYSAYKLARIEPKQLRDYMFAFLEIAACRNSALLMKENTPESLQKNKDYWQFMEDTDHETCLKLKNRFMGRALHLPGEAGRRFCVWAYGLARKYGGY